MPLIEEAEVEEAQFIMKNKIFAISIDKCIKLFPKSVELYIHSSILQFSKLQNEFKAIF